MYALPCWSTPKRKSPPSSTLNFSASGAYMDLDLPGAFRKLPEVWRLSVSGSSFSGSFCDGLIHQKSTNPASLSGVFTWLNRTACIPQKLFGQVPATTNNGKLSRPAGPLPAKAVEFFVILCSRLWHHLNCETRLLFCAGTLKRRKDLANRACDMPVAFAVAAFAFGVDSLLTAGPVGAIASTTALSSSQEKYASSSTSLSLIPKS
mmetsp:Transcript_21110/g.48896  ORF Transcript_21110/g.48896 Transcript_21110/m.48896 type:complete len:206 (+) Transcript_21110:541-1158(+)